MNCAWFVILVLAMKAPLRGQTIEPAAVPGSRLECKGVLQDGTRFERWDRVLLKEWEGQPLYVKVRAYYRPGPGEILWRSTGYSKAGYEIMQKENRNRAAAACEESYRHILLLRDGEWADFWAERGRIVMFHSKLKFSSPEKAWEYIGQHWRDGSDDPGSSTRQASEVQLYDELGREFFRPKSLESDARPYTYDSLVNVNKVGTNWVVEMKGADEPNRATVVLDENFKLLKATKDGRSR